MPAQALGLSLHGSAPITLEIGSRFFVERSQSRELRGNTQKAALAGDKMDFFSSLAGDEGFEPPITGPEPVALPLGQSPVCLVSFMSLRTCFVMFWSRTGLIIVYSVEGPRTAVALPLGQSPICLVSFMSLRTCFVMFWYRMVLTIIYSVEGPRTTVAFA